MAKIKCIILTIVLILSFEKSNASYIELKFDGQVKQLYDNTCGVASMVFVLNNYYSKNFSEIELMDNVGVKPEYSLLDLTNLNEKLKIRSVGVKISIDQLHEIHSPTIIYLNRFGKKHFVVFFGINGGVVQLYDPAWGYINYTQKQFDRYWREDGGLGRALIFLKDEIMMVDSKLIYQKNIFLIDALK